MLFERLVTGENSEYTVAELTAGQSAEDKAFTDDILQRVEADFSYLSYVIERYAEGFTFERIYKIDCAILLIAATEILFTDVPAKVAVNEAVELAKTYSTDKSSAFVNGILARILADKAQILLDRETFGQEDAAEETEDGEEVSEASEHGEDH